MKLYIAMLVVKDRERSTIKGLQILSNNWEYDNESDTWCIIYGWTTDKETMKEFKKYRNDAYYLYKKTEDEDYIDYITKEYQFSEIRDYNLVYGFNSDKKEKCSVPITMFETTCIENELRGMIEDSVSDEGKFIDPMLLSPRLYEIMEKIGYSNFYYENIMADRIEDEIDESHGDNEDFDPDVVDYDGSNEYIEELVNRMQVFFENKSYAGKHKYINDKGGYGNMYTDNQLNMFLSYFGELLNAGV